jgi:hypothetical protein
MLVILDYLGGRDQGAFGLKPAGEIVLWTLILKYPTTTTKRAGEVTEVVECLLASPEFKHYTTKKTQKTKNTPE